MKPRVLVNLLLLAAVVLLVVLVLNRNEQNAQQLHLTTLHRDAISHIVIPREKGDIVIDKKDGEWRMQSPYQIRAHQFRINRLLDLATSVVDKQYDFDEHNAAQFGLEKPHSRIRFDDTTITFGEKNPLNQKRYAQTGNHLYLVDDELYPLINAQPSSFADLQLLEPEQQIKAIELPGFSLQQNAQGGWRAQPDQHTDADTVNRFIEHWETAQAFGVHAYMARKQLGKIRITLQDNTIIELEITDTSPWLILGRPQLGIEYHFDRKFNDSLLKLPSTVSNPDNNDA